MRTKQTHALAAKSPAGFTLVEVLVVIIIIGILAALLIPAITIAVRRARTAAIKLEVDGLAAAVERYRGEYGDYPPDFSDGEIVARHYRNLFPRMAADERALLTNLLDDGSGNHDPTAMDRAEALVWCLGGYSDNTQRPFTGDGGPLVWNGTGARTDPAAHSINSERPNALFDFKTERLTYGASAPYSSSDDGDLFLTYRAREGGAPLVYFDSRTYDLVHPTLGSNGYGSGTFGYIRALVSELQDPPPTSGSYATVDEAFDAWKFVNPNSFQIISAGLDDNFGQLPPARSIHFQYPSGAAIEPVAGAANPGELLLSGVSKYQEGSITGAAVHGMPDNIANFSNAVLVDDVP